MSCDFAVWFPYRHLSHQEAGEVYSRLCAGDQSAVQAHPAVDAFYAELTARYPEIDTVPEDRIDDHDYCPWSGALDRSPGHILLSCVWSKAEEVARVLEALARKHGLTVYDPQAERVAEPAPVAASPWKFSCESKDHIPLPPAYTFPQAFNYLNPEKNSYYILEHENGNYMQCGGSKEACSVEMRIYGRDGAFKHFVIGHSVGEETPVAIPMSAGVTKVLAREVLKHWEAIELFECFFAGESLPAKYAYRETAL